MLNQELEKDLVISETPSHWERIKGKLDSVDFRDVNAALCYIIGDISQELLEQEPEAIDEAVQIAIGSLEHPNYTVQIAGIGILGKVTEEIISNENSERYLNAFNKSFDTLEEVAKNEEKKYKKRVEIIAKDNLPQVLEKL
jgi:hypothetical protein